jgi:hypothetical protein
VDIGVLSTDVSDPFTGAPTSPRDPYPAPYDALLPGSRHTNVFTFQPKEKIAHSARFSLLAYEARPRKE